MLLVYDFARDICNSSLSLFASIYRGAVVYRSAMRCNSICITILLVIVITDANSTPGETGLAGTTTKDVAASTESSPAGNTHTDPPSPTAPIPKRYKTTNALAKAEIIVLVAGCATACSILSSIVLYIISIRKERQAAAYEASVAAQPTTPLVEKQTTPVSVTEDSKREGGYAGSHDSETAKKESSSLGSETAKLEASSP